MLTNIIIYDFPSPTFFNIQDIHSLGDENDHDSMFLASAPERWRHKYKENI